MSLLPRSLAALTVQYGDIDTLPYRPPATWIEDSDIQPWTSQLTGKKYSLSTGHPIGLSQSVSLVTGLEADTDPASTSYWRMGYENPVQLTQWAFGSAPNQPVLKRHLARFTARIAALTDPFGGDIVAAYRSGVLHEQDPLSFTGPVAYTAAAKEVLNETYGVELESLTGLHDGGQSKPIGSILVLPITAFSPGRSKAYGNMGSKAISDHAARVHHDAEGTWRKFDAKVEYGKLCRTLFGLCKDWSKVPGV